MIWSIPIEHSQHRERDDSSRGSVAAQAYLRVREHLEGDLGPDPDFSTILWKSS
jgi:hypothetical protein